MSCHPGSGEYVYELPLHRSGNQLDRSRANGRSVRVNSIQANVHMLRYLKFGQEIVRSSGSPRGAAGYLVVDWRCRTLSFLTPR